MTRSGSQAYCCRYEHKVSSGGWLGRPCLGGARKVIVAGDIMGGSSSPVSDVAVGQGARPWSGFPPLNAHTPLTHTPLTLGIGLFCRGVGCFPPRGLRIPLMIFTRGQYRRLTCHVKGGPFHGQTHSRHHNHLSGTLLLNVVVVLRIPPLLP